MSLSNNQLSIQNFDFKLPIELIAQHPLPQRSASRLLYLERATGQIKHLMFNDLPSLLNSNDLLVYNDTKVIPARLFGKKTTGGKIEILIEKILEEHKALVQIKSNKPLKLGNKIVVADFLLEIVERLQDLFIITTQDATINAILQTCGLLPLPPYITHSPTANDLNRYQTIFAKKAGAVAAPTAGLHFDEALLQRLQQQQINLTNITLHVGAGTFQPIRTNNIEQHQMHAEHIEVNSQACTMINATKQRHGRIIAIGTTVVRSLETATDTTGLIKPYYGDTQIFIYEGYHFKCIDGLITNFHLPKSTLLLLVCAFGGYENIMRAYHEAINQRYRFFSYGDAMLII